MILPAVQPLEDNPKAGAIILCVLAQSTGPMDEDERRIVWEFVHALREAQGDPVEQPGDERLATELFQTTWSIKALQHAAARLVQHEPSARLFPHYFARMALAAGFVSADRRLAIKRIQAAIRRAGAKHKDVPDGGTT